MKHGAKINVTDNEITIWFNKDICLEEAEEHGVSRTIVKKAVAKLDDLEKKKIIKTTKCFDWKEESVFLAEVRRMRKAGYIHVYEGMPGTDSWCPVFSKKELKGANQYNDLY